MFSLEDFRIGQLALSFADADELPHCCLACIYLLYGETDVCFCDSAYFYYCGYSWPDKLTQTVPPCLKD